MRPATVRRRAQPLYLDAEFPPRRSWRDRFVNAAIEALVVLMLISALALSVALLLGMLWLVVTFGLAIGRALLGGW